ncbi:DinB family protein [Dictyobacter aurantiacus]|nr:DinB family protein [Dictyobacter aurantiacus]
MVYRLYLESGPQKKKTMVHVVDLPGCVVTGPTTDEALRRTPAVIRHYRELLKKHGVVVECLEDEIQIEVAQHIMEGSWLGNGDPALLVPTDLEPLTAEKRERSIQCAECMRAELLELVNGLSDEQWMAQPEKGRSIRSILQHIFGAEYQYIRGYFGKLDGVKGPGPVETMGRGELLAWMAFVRVRELEAIRAWPVEEQARQSTHGQQIKTASKVMRRMLEHQWEHLLEINDRVGVEI